MSQSTTTTYKATTLGDLLKKRGYDNTRVFWNGILNNTQKHDLVELGLCPNMKVLPPTVAKYLDLVVFEGKDRRAEFPQLPLEWH